MYLSEYLKEVYLNVVRLNSVQFYHNYNNQGFLSNLDVEFTTTAISDHHCATWYRWECMGPLRLGASLLSCKRIFISSKWIIVYVIFSVLQILQNNFIALTFTVVILLISHNQQNIDISIIDRTEQFSLFNLLLLNPPREEIELNLLFRVFIK